jgi:hypothetical protein
VAAWHGQEPLLSVAVNGATPSLAQLHSLAFPGARSEASRISMVRRATPLKVSVVRITGR